MPTYTITRVGHPTSNVRAHRVFDLRIDGKFVGTYETRKQAVFAAESNGAVKDPYAALTQEA